MATEADYTLAYRTELSVTVGSADVVDDGDGAFHKDFTIPQQNPDTAILHYHPRERRIGDSYGATVEWVDNVTLRLRWLGDPDQPEGLLNDESTGLDELIAVRVEVFDLNDFFVDMNTINFKLSRVLGYLGENVLQDLIDYDAAGNVVSYRLRIFNTRSAAEAATVDNASDDLEAGELCRVTMSQDIVMAKNDRQSLLRVLTDLLDTVPGNDEV